MARLGATREWAFRLMSLKPNREAMSLVRHALDDVEDAERLLRRPAVDEKPHILRAIDASLDVAQWRLRGVQKIIDEGTR